MAATWLLETILELAILGWPVNLLRAVTHSLPQGQAAQVTRTIVRDAHRYQRNLAMADLDRQQRSAERIQAAYAGWAARGRHNERRVARERTLAATRLQAGWRGKESRKQTEDVQDLGE